MADTTAVVQGDPFAPQSRENPVGYRTREFTVRAERAGEGDDAPLRIAISSEAPVERWDPWDPELRESGGVYDEVLDHGRNGIGIDNLNPRNSDPVAYHYRAELRGAGRVMHSHDGSPLPP